MTLAGELPLPPRPGEPIDGREDDDEPVPVLLPVESDHGRQYTGSCWVSPLDSPGMADDAPWDWGHGAERTVPLAGGSEYSGVYDIVTSWTSYCFPEDRYRFERHYERGGEFVEQGFELELPLNLED